MADSATLSAAVARDGLRLNRAGKILALSCAAGGLPENDEVEELAGLVTANWDEVESRIDGR